MNLTYFAWTRVHYLLPGNDKLHCYGGLFYCYYFVRLFIYLCQIGLTSQWSLSVRISVCLASSISILSVVVVLVVANSSTTVTVQGWKGIRRSGASRASPLSWSTNGRCKLLTSFGRRSDSELASTSVHSCS